MKNIYNILISLVAVFVLVSMFSFSSFSVFANENSVEPIPAATIHATKVVCDEESKLPNWGVGAGPDITSSTATIYVAEHSGCSIVPWDFQWALSTTANPGNNTTGTPSGWTSFTESVDIALPITDAVVSDSFVWIRENIDTAYIPFSGDSAPFDDEVSAELYCKIDHLNYDNYDRVDGGLIDGGNYYCVGFNVLKNTPPPVDACPNEETDPGIQTTTPCPSEDVCKGVEGIQTSTDDCPSPTPSPTPTPTPPNDDETNDSNDSNGGGGGGGGGSSGSSGSRARIQDQGEVAGESICNFAIDTYMRKGYRNNSSQVQTLQALLNKYTGSGLGVDGMFGAKTEAAVRVFQAKYTNTILTPWSLTAPTGIFYKTTLVQAKNLECPEVILPIPTDLINWSRNLREVPSKI